jgi:NADH-quinone oxidoreductase subunit A
LFETPHRARAAGLPERRTSGRSHGGGAVWLLRRPADTVRPGQTGTSSVPVSIQTFEPILLFAAVLVAFVIVNLILAHTIGPRRQTPVKSMPYESGMDPIADARQPFDVKFSLVAILFLIFDVELLFLFPWTVSAYSPEGVPVPLRRDVFWVMIVFIVTLLIPYIYAWKKGVFRWR